jgi:hypothetical protein
MELDPRLWEYATDKQKQILSAVQKEGSIKEAAKVLSISRTTVAHYIMMAKRQAAKHGYAPEYGLNNPTPPGFAIKGTSTLYDAATGEAKLQWVKTSPEAENLQQALKEFCDGLTEDMKGKSKVIAPPNISDSDLLTIYGIGDPHLGLHAWGKETGTDFDLDIAERVNKAAFDRLIASSPESRTALIMEVGDLLHADNNTARTPTSGNPLDVDTRHAKVMQVAARMLRHMIEHALRKHEKVVVWLVRGNHDIHSSYAISLILSAFYENNKRVQVDLSPGPYKYMRFGEVMIASVHGDGAKPADMPLIMATDRREDWGATKHRYVYTGHIHHETRKEIMGTIVESLRSLAPSDAWHNWKGYRAGRDMKAITLHAKFGEVERHTANIGMVENDK